MADETAGAPGADTPAVETPEVPEWDGGLDTLDAQPWWSGVPDPAKEHIRGQYERGAFYKNLSDSDDAVATLTKEMDGLRASLGAEVEKYKSEAKSWQDKHAALDKEHTAFRNEVEQESYARKDAEMKRDYPDIYETYTKAETDEDKQNSAFAMFVRLVEHQGESYERAAKMVRAAFDMPAPGAKPAETAPARPKTRDVTPPASVDLASKGDGNPATTTTRPEPMSEAEARRKLMQKIEDEEALSGNV